jgi:hypothetical protein
MGTHGPTTAKNGLKHMLWKTGKNIGVFNKAVETDVVP